MLRQAIAAVAVILGCVALGLLVVSAAVDRETLESGALSRLPACSARLAGGSCLLCGMSHSLVAMSRGDWAYAARWNAGGPWLYMALIVQAGLAAAVLGWRLFRPPVPRAATARDNAG